MKCIGCGLETMNPSYCTIECFRKNAKGKKHSCYQPNLKTKNCPECRKKFREKRKIFCSMKCYQAKIARDNTGICANCGDSFNKLKKEQVTCGEDCRRKFFVREKTQMWNGGEYQDAETGCEHVLIASRKYRRKPRIIAAELIGRDLFADERVWHLDRDRTNNNSRNLYIFRSASEMARAINLKNLPQLSNIRTFMEKQYDLP